jgi:hypothetical protein
VKLSINYRDLMEYGACHEQRHVFLDRFPGRSVLATVSTAIAHADDFEWDWAANAFLRTDHNAQYWRKVDQWRWSDVSGLDDEETFIVFRRYKAAAFAEAFLAQGRLPRLSRPERSQGYTILSEVGVGQTALVGTISEDR